ncbi:MAG: hypothetical protein A4E28_01565 [Methanocella sp. PtaU1.Bin125]|nr:MAG: hypothetical protein A4E28_01565 [Methanocella sp. PtaU1.Bin125]
MISGRLLAVAVFAAYLLAVPGIASASYAGDKPLSTVFYDDFRGSFAFDTGNSTYNGSVVRGNVTVTWVNVTVPENATVRYQRLYVYWSWSMLNQTAIYPTLIVNMTGDREQTLELKDRYVDSKGFVSSYDFFTGMDTYEVPGIGPGSNNFTFTVTQAGPPGSLVSLYGMGLLVVYEDPGEPRRMLWVKEGADMVYNAYGISAEMATSRLAFDGDVPRDLVSEAHLDLVAPSGGYSRYNLPAMNRLLVNYIPDSDVPELMRSLLSILFPKFRGKTWTNFFYWDYASQVGLDSRDITPYIRSRDNHVDVRDMGDYFQLTNAVLSITLKDGGGTG